MIMGAIQKSTRTKYQQNLSVVFARTDDVSWSSSQQHRSLLSIVVVGEQQQSTDDDGTDNGEKVAVAPDYGGLNVMIRTYGQPSMGNFQRHVNDAERFETEREELLDDMDEIQHGGMPLDTWDEYDSDHSDQCMAPRWTFVHQTNCNTIHEIADRNNNPGSFFQYLGRGYYRDAFFYHDSMDDDDGFVMKKLHLDRDVNQRQLFKVNNEAFIMEHLSGSGLAGHLYGHCGTTVLVEPGQDLSHQICKIHPQQSVEMERGYFSFDILYRLHHEKEGFYQNNDLSPIAKLRLAISMVESIALLHGFPLGVIAHDDISLDQWMLSGLDDHRVILNDFNSIRPLHVDVTTGHYCRFHSRTGNYKAPEYFTTRQKLVTEQSDVWALGLVLYTLLTGTLKSWWCCRRRRRRFC
jgi:serine/threonine protein kinase